MSKQLIPVLLSGQLLFFLLPARLSAAKSVESRPHSAGGRLSPTPTHVQSIRCLSACRSVPTSVGQELARDLMQFESTRGRAKNGALQDLRLDLGRGHLLAGNRLPLRVGPRCLLAMTGFADSLAQSGQLRIDLSRNRLLRNFRLADAE